MANDLTDPVFDALIATPMGRWIQRRRAAGMMKSYRDGQRVAVTASRRARPQDSWQSGELTASTATARWHRPGEADSFELAAIVAERLVGTAREGVVVFSLSDGVELSVAAVNADVVRAVMADQAR